MHWRFSDGQHGFHVFYARLRLWQRGFDLLNCLVLRRLLASVRSGAVKNFRYRANHVS